MLGGKYAQFTIYEILLSYLLFLLLFPFPILYKTLQDFTRHNGMAGILSKVHKDNNILGSSAKNSLKSLKIQNSAKNSVKSLRIQNSAKKSLKSLNIKKLH